MKATHFGICQACGRQQKLPGGVLAKHGYELRHGFMSGVCFGAGHLPFEVSCGLIQQTIDWARRDAASLAERISAIRARKESADDLATWYQVYHPELSSRSRGSVRLWEAVTVVVDDKGRLAYELTKHKGTSYEKTTREPAHAMGTAAALANMHRGYYADALERTRRERLEYAETQAARIASWAPRELTPINPERTAA